MKNLKTTRHLPVQFLRLADQVGDEPTDEQDPPSGCTAEMLAAINAMPQVLRPMTADQVLVRGMWAINDQPMHSGLKIEPAGMSAIASMAVGVPIQANHDTFDGVNALPLGRVFAANAVQRPDGSNWVRLLYWMPRTEMTEELAQRIDGGAIGEVSVSIGYDKLECSICKTDLFDCAHQPGETYDGQLCEGIVRGISDFYECSLVWAGQAKGTSMFMAAAKTKEVLDVDELLAKRAEATAGGLALLFEPLPSPMRAQAEDPLAGLFERDERSHEREGVGELFKGSGDLTDLFVA